MSSAKHSFGVDDLLSFYVSWSALEPISIHGSQAPGHTTL